MKGSRIFFQLKACNLFKSNEPTLCEQFFLYEILKNLHHRIIIF